VWIVLRNITPSLRTVSLGLYGWLGCITLETYVSQFHTWLATGIPDGQPKMLLAFFPADYPLLNFAGTTAGKTTPHTTAKFNLQLPSTPPPPTPPHTHTHTHTTIITTAAQFP
jgi:hypothetical protein